jgi:hypothetical protein
MFTPMVVLLALLLAGGTAVYFAARRAPEGYEDEDGFHLGIERERAIAADDRGTGSLAAAYAPNRNVGDVGARLRVRRRSDEAAIHRV